MVNFTQIHKRYIFLSLVFMMGNIAIGQVELDRTILRRPVDLKVLRTLSLADVNQKPSKIALLIGNSAYEGRSRLSTPVNDLEAIRVGLDTLGFAVTTLKNGTKEQMQNSLDEFRIKSRDARITYLYYAGHTAQYRDRNYLIPVDALLEEYGDIPRQGISLRNYIRGLNREAENMISIDACYPNRFSYTNPTGVEENCFAPPGKLPSRAFATFTTYENVMAPGTDERTSLFSYLFSFHLQKSASIYEIILATKARLKRLSSGRADISIFGEVSTSTNLKMNQVVLYSIQLPGFPWRPPKPSESDILEREFFEQCETLEDVDDILYSALEKQGYTSKSYFSIDTETNHGFALVTRLEQINEDGTSVEGDARWKTTPWEDQTFSFSKYFESLFFPQKGHFRIIVFLVTDLDPKPWDDAVGRGTAISWLEEGKSKLPPEMKRKSFTENYDIMALIYEYELRENDSKATLEDPSDLQGREHLVKSNLWSTLSGNE